MKKILAVVFAFAFFSAAVFAQTCNYSCFSPDSLDDNATESIGQSNETTLQDFLAGKGYDFNVVRDQTNTQVWHDANIVELQIKFLGKFALQPHVFGYYLNGDANSFVPLFEDANHPSYNLPIAQPDDTFTVNIPAGSTIGFAIDSWENGQNFFYTENSKNPTSVDHVLVFDSCDEFVLAFEDKITDFDFQDIVVSVKKISCTPAPVCGDGIQNGLEQCDSGPNTDRPHPDTADDGSCVIDSTNTPASCKNNLCGDAYLNSPIEQCDFGSLDSNTGQCNASCAFTRCGDGITQPLNGSGQFEECDDGGTISGDGCSAVCTIETGGTPQGINVLEVEISKITNKATGEQTEVFSDNDTMTLEIKVISHSASNINGQLKVTAKPVESSATIYPIHDDATTETFTANTTTTFSYDFLWSGKPNGSYEITATVPVQPGEEQFARNNSDNKFISLVQKKGNPVAVPETNLLLAPLAAFAAVALIYFSSRR